MESVYCSLDFKLSDPETFNQVIPLHLRRQCSNLKDIFTHQSDKLSQHLDAVELAIVNHVSVWLCFAFIFGFNGRFTCHNQWAQIENQVVHIFNHLEVTFQDAPWVGNMPFRALRFNLLHPKLT